MVSVLREVGGASRRVASQARSPAVWSTLSWRTLALVFVYKTPAAPTDYNPPLSLSPLPTSLSNRSGVARANFWPVLRSMPRGRRFRVPPSAQRSSFDPFAVQAACAQGATPRKGSLIRLGPEISDLSTSSFTVCRFLPCDYAELYRSKTRVTFFKWHDERFDKSEIFCVIFNAFYEKYFLIIKWCRKHWKSLNF